MYTSNMGAFTIGDRMALMSFHVGSVTKNLLFLCVQKAQKHNKGNHIQRRRQCDHNGTERQRRTKAEDQVNSEWTSKK